MSNDSQLAMNLQRFRLPIFATTGAVLVYYWFLSRQSRLKYKLVKEYEQQGKIFDRYQGGDGRMLSVDRVAGNTQEQLIPFLASLWLHAIFVDPDTAGKLGFLWIGLRIAYRFIMPQNLKYRQPKTVAFVTFPQYFIIGYLLLKTATKAYKINK